MDTKQSSKRKFKWMYANILRIFTILSIVLSATGGVYAQEEPSPWLRAFPDQDSVDGYYWPADQQVSLEIDGLEFETTVDSEGHVEFLLTGYDLKQGDLLTMSSGDITIVHTVKQLFVTDINLDTQTVAGTVDGEEVVHVWTGEAELYVESDESGNWFADFSGFDDPVVFPGTCGNAEAWGEGASSTIVDWCVPSAPPNPYLIAFPVNEAVEAYLWPPGSSLHLSIDSQGAGGLPDFEQDATMPPGDPYGVWVRIDFAGAYDLQPGDVVTLTDGETPRTHVVQNLSVTAVDADVDTVAGTAYPGAVVQVWPHEGGDLRVEATAGENGAWLADFSGLFDLVIGTGGRSQILDEFGNATAVDWEAPIRYDIYTFDPLTGEIRQITNLPYTDEYNPSWSPNGKKIAHDVVNSNGSHAIYITDVKTGVSAPLAGAEDGGNDAVWSQNGKSIVFDRLGAGDPSLYLVPATGGLPTLVREDAVSADWAPNGKRLVFQQPSDGSIRTVPLDGGGGGETTIAASGANPAWSPDGNWIAYENDGDIWKVRVNVQGTVFGEPIQVTSGPRWDGQPTWSADSMTIVFHAGIGSDFDLWMIPAEGGDPTWLNGAPGFGDYDPAYAKNSSNIAYASFSPAGQEARSWVAAYTYDYGTWSEGDHNYHFEAQWNGGSETTDEVYFNVSSGAMSYGGYVLLRPGVVRAGSECQAIDAIRHDQPTRFLAGYLTDYAMTHPEAQAFFEGLTARAVWDEGMSAELAPHEIMPFRWDDWFQYVCTFNEAPPKMDLRVNYGHDWVESFYEAGHTVWITVTESDGFTVKATAELATEPKDFWGGETGFVTQPEDWNPDPPDIQPYDWVFGWVDNGASAQVQIGDISGEIDLEADSIEGTILAPWIADPVQVECLDWGSGGEPFDNKDGGSILTNGSESYLCSWAGEWDIQPWQDVGVGYFTPDGHWVANAFFVPNPRIIASAAGDWFWTTDFNPGTLNLFIYESADEAAALLWQDSRDADEWGFVFIGYDDHGQDLVPGNYLVVTDGVTEKELLLETITMEVFDIEDEIMAGTAPAGREVRAVAGVEDGEQGVITITADLESGYWLADFKTIEFDITEEMRGWSFAHIYDEDGDANEATPPAATPTPPTPHFYVFPEWDYIIGWEWPPEATIMAEVYHSGGAETPDCETTAEMVHPEWDDEVYVAEFFLAGVCDIQVGDYIVLTDGDIARDHIVFPLQVNLLDLDADMIGGVAAPDIEVQAWVHGEEGTFQTVMPDGEGNWVINFHPFDLMAGMGGRVEQFDEDGDATSVDWWIPNPYIRAHPVWDSVDAWFWPQDATLHLSIDDPNTESSPDLEMDMPGEVDPDIGSVWFDFARVYDLKPGDLVTVTDGVTTKILIVSILSIDAVDVEADSASGKVEPGREVRLPSPDNELFVTGDSEGYWFADFNQIGFDLTPGTMVIAEVFDEDGDNSSFEWYIPNTRFTVWPEWNYLEGYEWPDGAVVSISVAGKEVCATEAVSGFPEWDPWNTFFSVNFPEGCAIEAGDHITLSSESLSLTHQVPALAVTEVNLDGNTVVGTAVFDPEQYILHTWIHGFDGSYMQLLAEGGTWLADFGSQGFDLQPGMGGRVELVDQASNATAVEWWIPKIEIKAFPMADVVWGYGWPEGSQVHLTLNGAVDFVPPATVGPAPWGDPNDIMAYFELTGYDLVPGDVVTLSGNGLEQTHTVRNLSVTAVDAAANTVTGMADEELYVWVHGFDGTELHLTPQDGTWLADFGSIPFDLMDGMCGRAEIGDEAGNSTAVDWCVPPP